jgi:hypothetical protein
MPLLRIEKKRPVARTRGEISLTSSGDATRRCESAFLPVSFLWVSTTPIFGLRGMADASMY